MSQKEKPVLRSLADLGNHLEELGIEALPTTSDAPVLENFETNKYGVRFFNRICTSRNGTYSVRVVSPYDLYSTIIEYDYSKMPTGINERDILFSVDSSYGPLSVRIYEERAYNSRKRKREITGRSISFYKGIVTNYTQLYYDDILFSWYYLRDNDADSFYINRPLTDNCDSNNQSREKYGVTFSREPSSQLSYGTDYLYNSTDFEKNVDVLIRSPQSGLQEPITACSLFEACLDWEQKGYASRAYFGHDGKEYLAVLKKGKSVSIEFYTKGEEVSIKTGFESSKEDDFTLDDIDTSIAMIGELPFDSEFRKAVIDNLQIYKNVHVKDPSGREFEGIISLSPDVSAKEATFDKILNDVRDAKNSDRLVKYVESLIKVISEVVMRSPEEMLSIDKEDISKKELNNTNKSQT